MNKNIWNATPIYGYPYIRENRNQINLVLFWFPVINKKDIDEFNTRCVIMNVFRIWMRNISHKNYEPNCTQPVNKNIIINPAFSIIYENAVIQLHYGWCLSYIAKNVLTFSTSSWLWNRGLVNKIKGNLNFKAISTFKKETGNWDSDWVN